MVCLAVSSFCLSPADIAQRMPPNTRKIRDITIAATRSTVTILPVMSLAFSSLSVQSGLNLPVGQRSACAKLAEERKTSPNEIAKTNLENLRITIPSYLLLVLFVNINNQAAEGFPKRAFLAKYTFIIPKFAGLSGRPRPGGVILVLITGAVLR